MALVINGKTLLDAAPIKQMEREKKIAHGMSYGLSEVGYDIRLKQKVEFYPGKIHYLFDPKIYVREVSKIHVDGEAQISDRFCLGSSIEEFDMPADMVGRLYNKSSLARLGIDASMTTVIEPGWKGFLTIEITFNADEPVTLEAGSPIGQVIFEYVTHAAPYTGKYQNQADEPVPIILEHPGSRSGVLRAPKDF